MLFFHRSVGANSLPALFQTLSALSTQSMQFLKILHTVATAVILLSFAAITACNFLATYALFLTFLASLLPNSQLLRLVILTLMPF